MKNQAIVGNVVYYGGTLDRKVQKKQAFSASQLSPELVILVDCAQPARKPRGAEGSLSPV